MCICIQETEIKIKEMFIEKIGYDSVIDFGYAYKGFLFGKKLTAPIFFPFELTYLPKKADGSLGKKKTYKTSMLFTYCPFCGKKYKKP